MLDCTSSEISRLPRAQAFGVIVLLSVALGLAPATPAGAQELGPRYARGFDLRSVGNATLVTVYSSDTEDAEDTDGGPQDDESTGSESSDDESAQTRYLLVERGERVPDGYPDATVMRTPVRSVITLSSTYLSAFAELAVAEHIVGHDRRSWVYSEEIRSRMRNGDIAEVGSGGDLDLEKVLSLDPEVVFSYDAGTQAENPYPRVEDLDVPVVTTSEFREHEPLGRSEWLLFFSAFFDLEDTAREIFSSIEQRYLELRRVAKEGVETREDRPTVFLNVPWGSSWAMPKGDNYSAVFLDDAQSDYVFADRGGTGTLHLDFETVLSEAGEADFWINPGQWQSLEEGREQNRRFRLFDAFAEGRVYNNNARVAEDGGNDYFESGYLYADRILADLISIFHPDLLPDHDLYYYRQLQ